MLSVWAQTPALTAGLPSECGVAGETRTGAHGGDRPDLGGAVSLQALVTTVWIFLTFLPGVLDQSSLHKQ